MRITMLNAENMGTVKGYICGVRRGLPGGPAPEIRIRHPMARTSREKLVARGVYEADSLSGGSARQPRVLMFNVSPNPRGLAHMSTIP